MTYSQQDTIDFTMMYVTHATGRAGPSASVVTARLSSSRIGGLHPPRTRAG